MRKPIVAGNWKCNKTSKEALELLGQLKAQIGNASDAEVVLCPPFTSLAALSANIGTSSMALGAQDVFWEAQGAFTGEVSPGMLVDLGCKFCIIGHSERRQYFKETDEQVHKKLVALLTNKITPIICVGETLNEREQGSTFKVIGAQLDGALEGISASDAKRIVIAYEPVWAIGTGKTATSAQAQEVHAFIRDNLTQRFGAEVAKSIRIQYGGSVTAANALELMQQPDVDGALVGGASLKADSFGTIVKAAGQAKAVNKCSTVS
jgi:triosephosphate isomerase (TIM)